MRTLGSISLAAVLMLLHAGGAVAGTAMSEEIYLALASCPDRATGSASAPVGELTQSVEDKNSTDAALSLLKEYLEFHDQAQADTGARAALMPWSGLATHAN